MQCFFHKNEQYAINYIQTGCTMLPPPACASRQRMPVRMSTRTRPTSNPTYQFWIVVLRNVLLIRHGYSSARDYCGLPGLIDIILVEPLIL
jgi:hypothetical protein